MEFDKPPQPEQRVGKFASARDETLHAITLNGWGNQSSGDVEAPTGHFCYVAIEPAELSEIAEAFEDEIASAGLNNTNELVGYFIVQDDEQGFVNIFTFDDRPALDEAYAKLQEEYDRWYWSDVQREVRNKFNRSEGLSGYDEVPDYD